jgi:hypothetical protein
MAKTSLKSAGRRATEVQGARYTPAVTVAAVRTRCTASSACAVSASARWHTLASFPASRSSADVITTAPQVCVSAEPRVRKAGMAMTMTRPDRGHADASAERQLGVPRQS